VHRGQPKFGIAGLNNKEVQLFVTAHTNKPGYYEKWDVRTRSWIGVSNDVPINGIEQYGVKVGTSLKSPTIKSDHKFPTEYYRDIRQVVIDKPFVQRQHYGEPPARITRLLYTSSIAISSNNIMDQYPATFQLRLDDAASKAVTKALANLQENRVSYGASIGEGRATAEGVAKLSIEMLNAYKAFKRGFGIQWLKQSVGDRKIAEKYLEFVYGWQPTMADIYSGAKILAEGIAGEGYTYTVEGRARASFKQEYPNYDLHSYLWECVGGTRVSYTVKITDGGVYAAEGLGLINPVEVAWELVPFSFVVDWFVPVGSVLSTLTATSGLELASGYITNWSQTSISKWRPSADMYWELVDSGLLVSRRMITHRNPIFDFQLPHLYDKRNPFSTKHILNAIALIAASV